VAPLISKLPDTVQGRILRVAGQVLESTNMFNAKNRNSDNGNNSSDKNNSNSNGSTSSSTNNEKEVVKRKSVTNINHQPFLGLVLTCLKKQDEQKEGLLQSLHSQLCSILQNKELENIGGIEDPYGREEMLDALQLRFSLVGGMFEAIQKNSNTTTDWAVLLTQLISQGIIDLNNNS
jgi:mediator of RNA polymerase II transcription subunit 12